MILSTFLIASAPSVCLPPAPFLPFAHPPVPAPSGLLPLFLSALVSQPPSPVSVFPSLLVSLLFSLPLLPARPFSLPFWWPASRAQPSNRNATLRHFSRAFDVAGSDALSSQLLCPRLRRRRAPSLSPFFLIFYFCCILSSLRARFFDSPSISPQSFSLCPSLLPIALGCRPLPSLLFASRCACSSPCCTRRAPLHAAVHLFASAAAHRSSCNPMATVS